MTPLGTHQVSAEATKACCATAYGSDLAALLLGDSYHPGSRRLTRHLTHRLGLASRSRVLDLAAGPGTSALLLAEELDLCVDGLDLSPANVALARGAADAAGLTDRARFTVGDAERLPYPDGGFDAAVVECALCTFPDKRAAVTEVSRVLRPGGRLGITDVVVESERLPEPLTTLAARIACIADARPMAYYAELIEAAGLRVTHAERHDDALARMIDQIEARLSLVRLTARTRLDELGVDLDRAAPALAAARTAVVDGVLGYGLLTAEKP